MEAGLRDALFRDARAWVEKLLNDRSLIHDEEPPRSLEVVYKDRSCQVQTLFGRITLKRRYYHHIKARTGRCPMDHRLDLVRGHLPGITRLICRASALSHSYEAAAEDLKAYLGLEFNGRCFARLVNHVVPELKAAQASLPVASPAKPVAIMYAGCDGTGVPMRRGELDGVKGKQPDGSAHTREVKLGCIFTQTSTDQEGLPMRDPASTSYVGTFEGCREIGSLLRAEALRRGYATAKEIVCLGDGAPWIWENARLNFPDATQILDFYHASEHAGSLAKTIFGAGAEANAQQTQWCHAMKETSGTIVITEARTLLNARGADFTTDQIMTIEREIDYFITHENRTRYGEYRAKGYFIGSGVVEAGCKTVVGQRLKQSGMFWSRSGGDHLLTLRCMMLHPSFSTIWKARIPILEAQHAKAPKWTSDLN